MHSILSRRARYAASVVITSMSDVENRSVIDSFLDYVCNQYPLVDEDLLLNLGQRLLMRNISQDARATIIAYFKHMLTQSNGIARFEFAAQIVILSRKPWCLSSDSLDFLQELKSANQTVFQAFIAKLDALCCLTDRGLALEARHVDAVIASLQKQKQLPADMLRLLSCYLDTHSPDIYSIIDDLRAEHGHDLTRHAQAYHLQHHTVYHALEVKARAMEVLTTRLELFCSTQALDVFLREIASLSIEFHDHEQKIAGQYPSAEQATAARLASWLIEKLNLSHHKTPGLIPFIEFFVDRIIVLGTTMIFSKTSTMDLLELFFMVEEAASDAHISVGSTLNKKLINILNMVALVTSVCDKNPTSIRHLMEKEAGLTCGPQKALRRLPRSLLLGDFFRSTLQPYFDAQDQSQIINEQVWLTTWTAHFNMRVELGVQKYPQQAVALLALMSRCQEKRMSGVSEAEFMIWFQSTLDRIELSELIETVFFADIAHEIEFSLSQTATLKCMSEKLDRLMHLTRPHDEAYPLIDWTVPQQDANNMQRFGAFYSASSSENKRALLHELLLVAVLQAGIAYAMQPEFAYTQQVTHHELASSLR